ncbi:MAG: SDR family NAD(P)-dependent oxidoreductase, partial [Actinomycetota bacterium]|nr:SDR family NAD(P)-dependent oxidoreductase [Actinomycetota bacterium]
MGQHQGKAIFLTGASTGIGRATALRLAAEGASLVLADIAKDKLEKTTKECQSLGSETISIECDVSNEMQIS